MSLSPFSSTGYSAELHPHPRNRQSEAAARLECGDWSPLCGNILLAGMPAACCRLKTGSRTACPRAAEDRAWKMRRQVLRFTRIFGPADNHGLSTRPLGPRASRPQNPAANDDLRLRHSQGLWQESLSVEFMRILRAGRARSQEARGPTSPVRPELGAEAKTSAEGAAPTT